MPPAEAGVRTALTGLALFVDRRRVRRPRSSSARCNRTRPAAPTQFLLGAARAMQSRDPDAIAAWQAAIATEAAPAITSQLLIEAYLRRNDLQRATERGATTPAGERRRWTRSIAATHIASRRDADAIALLDAASRGHAGRPGRAMAAAARALRAVCARRRQAAAAAGRGALRDSRRTRYIDAKGAQRALAEEWLAMRYSSCRFERRRRRRLACASSASTRVRDVTLTFGAIDLDLERAASASSDRGSTSRSPST